MRPGLGRDSRGQKSPLCWREAAPWPDPLGLTPPGTSPGTSSGRAGLRGTGTDHKHPVNPVVPLGKVNPAPLATCPALPAHGVLTLGPHVGAGEGRTRGTLTLLPERSADGDKLPHPHALELWLAGNSGRFRLERASSLPPSPRPTAPASVSQASANPRSACVSCSELREPGQEEGGVLRPGPGLPLLRFQLKQGSSNCDGQTHHPQVSLKYKF